MKIRLFRDRISHRNSSLLRSCFDLEFKTLRKTPDSRAACLGCRPWCSGYRTCLAKITVLSSWRTSYLHGLALRSSRSRSSAFIDRLMLILVITNQLCRSLPYFSESSSSSWIFRIYSCGEFNWNVVFRFFGIWILRLFNFIQVRSNHNGKSLVVLQIALQSSSVDQK